MLKIEETEGHCSQLISCQLTRLLIVFMLYSDSLNGSVAQLPTWLTPGVLYILDIEEYIYMEDNI